MLNNYYKFAKYSMNGALTRSGLFIYVSSAKRILGGSYQLLLNKLTISTIQKIGPAKVSYMYRIGGVNNRQCLFIPRTMLLKLNSLFTFDIQLGGLVNIQASLLIDLYDNQQLLVNYFCDNIFTPSRISAGTATAILNLKAGMGKTYIAAGIISRLRLKCLYIVVKRPLMVQAIKDLRLALGEHSAGDTEDYPIMVMVINSVLLRNSSFLSQFSMVVLDEVHSYCSDKRKEVFYKCCTHVVLGMSATTSERKDGFDIISHRELAFDDVIHATSVPGFTQSADNFTCIAKIINYYGMEEYTANLIHPSTNIIFTPYMHKQFISDSYRTSIVIDELIKLYDWTENGARHCIYVFAEEIDILRKAQDMFVNKLLMRDRNDIVAACSAPELEDCSFAKSAELFTGAIKSSKVDDIIAHSRILFTTYGYAGTGISIPKMTAIVFLTPRRSGMNQILARILRRGSDTRIPRIVIDIVDKKTALTHQAKQRRLAYDYYNFTCEFIKRVAE